MMSEVDPRKQNTNLKTQQKTCFTKMCFLLVSYSSCSMERLFQNESNLGKTKRHTPQGAASQITTHGPGPQNHLRCRYCVRSHASPPSWSPSSLEFESGIRIGNAPFRGENCRFRGWPLKLGQSWAPSPNINIGSLQGQRVIVQVWVNFDRTICFFQQKDWTENFVYGPCLCWDTPRVPVNQKWWSASNPSAPAASRYPTIGHPTATNSTAPRPSRTCQIEATKVNQHPQNFLGQGELASFTEFVSKQKCHWNLMFHSLYVLQVENHVGLYVNTVHLVHYMYTIVQ